MKYHIILLSAVLIFSLSACKKDSTPATTDTNMEYPSYSGGPTLYSGQVLYDYLNSSFTSIRYSPAIIENTDNSLDVWFTIPGGYHATALAYFNQISYIHSDDAGKTWTQEEIVLKPTAGAVDQYYVRNPSVIKVGGYYYMTYESRTNGTTTSSGSNNNLYVCRASSPSGPWDKWNGSSWGGNPSSILKITPGKVTYYGVGESSMLVQNDSIYLYYSIGKDSSLPTRTLCIKAPANDTLWPSKITTAVDTIFKRNTRLSNTVISYNGSDRISFKYDDSKNTFYAMGIMNRLTDSSYIQVWSSPDGVHFNEEGKITNGFNPYASFIGLSADAEGHWNSAQDKYMIYTYGNASVLLANTYFNVFTF